MQKKAQGISINTIIIAALGLAVLVVLFLVFTGRFKIFSEGVKGASITCESACKTSGYANSYPSFGECLQGGYRISGKFEGLTENQICCCV